MLGAGLQTSVGVLLACGGVKRGPGRDPSEIRPVKQQIQCLPGDRPPEVKALFFSFSGAFRSGEGLSPEEHRMRLDGTVPPTQKFMLCVMQLHCRCPPHLHSQHDHMTQFTGQMVRLC